MALNDIERRRIEKAVGAYVEKRRSASHIRPKLDFGFRVSGQSVELLCWQAGARRPCARRPKSGSRPSGRWREIATAEGWGRKVPRPFGAQSILYGDKVINIVNSSQNRVGPAQSFDPKK